MTDATVAADEPTVDVSESEGPPVAERIHLGWAVAGLSAAAGGIHLAMVPSHAGDSLLDPVGFAAVGWFQLVVAAVILLGRDGRNLYRAAVVGNLAVIGLWLWSRTTGLPFGSHSGVAEDVTMVDGVATALQVGVVLLSARILARYGKDVPQTATVEIGSGTKRPLSFHVEEIDSDAMLMQQETP